MFCEKPKSDVLLPNFDFNKTFKKLFCLAQSVPSCLVFLFLCLVPLTMPSRGPRAALDLGGISSKFLSEEIPDVRR